MACVAPRFAHVVVAHVVVVVVVVVAAAAVVVVVVVVAAVAGVVVVVPRPHLPRSSVTRSPSMCWGRRIYVYI